MFESYHIWWASVIVVLVVVLSATFLFILYSYLIGRLPKAVWLRKLEERLLSLEGKVHAEEETLRNLSKENEEQKKLAADLQDLTNRLTATKNSAEQWLDEHKNDVAKIDEWKEKIATLTSKLAELEKKLLEDQEKRESVLRATSEAEIRLNAINAKVEELKADESTIKANLESIQAEYDELKIKLEELKAIFAQEKVRLSSLQDELERVQKEVDSMQSKLESIENNRREAEKELQDAIARKEGIEKEIEAKQQTMKGISELVANMEAQVQNFKPPKIEERLEDFHRPLFSISHDIEEYAKSEEDLLCDFENKLKESGYIFHERVIHSFHTSLKIADIAPLVVLSGISGTGKSQLPRLYSKYMGMQFLNVSVQPRWDAPEDLFGFYNYMEHRYKATELARALRQMDVKYHPAQEGTSDFIIQNGMLLVLLDEMNLARVEYYFSELLSKLEMRSRAQLDDEKMYERSSIQVQAGSLKDGDEDQNRPLFVGYNVVFVGTMNEDESTQALSDKVLDRANVLRFGKPPNCESREIKEDKSNDNYMLNKNTWSNWISNALSAEDEEYINSKCSKINDALQKVGRAFGHRIHQAISQYVANYPLWIEGRREKAFADQLEQKILPKLRGLSHDTDDGLEDVFNTIADVISELEDKELYEAFSVARDKPVFDFKGVNREV